MNTDQNYKECHRLFVAKTDGTITEEEHERLCGLLKESAEIRRLWFAFQDAESALLAWSQKMAASYPESVSFSSEGKAVGSSRPVPGRFGMYYGAIAAGIAVALVIWQVRSQFSGQVNSGNPSLVARGESTTKSVAVLSRGVNVQWDESGATPEVNSPISPGVLRLRSGVAEIEFFHGARLCVEGPAEIQIISAGEAFCRSGRFSAHVPLEARGFRLGTPKGDIVDLGTDFGLDLNEVSPELHVFKGEVELHQPKVPMRMLTTGLATGLNPAVSGQTLAANASAFAFRDLDAGVSESNRLAFADWQKAAVLHDADPDLLVRLDFQDGAGARSLRNTTNRGTENAPGTIVGGNWTEGRWAGKHALQFRSLSDRVRLTVPGKIRQATLACWVQVQGLNIKQSSICMTEGVDAGYVHWQVLHDGSLCLGIGSKGKPVWDDYISPVVFTPERFGQWVHLAVVYDGAGGEVRHYVNGKCLVHLPIKRAVELTPGVMELGNWTTPATPEYRLQPVRNFTGCMDEFSFLSRALKDDEVRSLAK